MKRLKFFVSAFLVGLTVIVSSCDKVEFKEEPLSFSFATESITMRKGEIRKLAYPIYSTNYNISQITFELTNSYVVSLDDQMQLVAANIGDTDLIAKISGEELRRLRIIVREP